MFIEVGLESCGAGALLVIQPEVVSCKILPSSILLRACEVVDVTADMYNRVYTSLCSVLHTW